MRTPFNEKEKKLLTIIKSIYDDFQFKKIEPSTCEIIKDGKVIAARSILVGNKSTLMKIIKTFCQDNLETIQSVKEENNLLIITLKTLTEKEKNM